jgi:hypothetical protein
LPTDGKTIDLMEWWFRFTLDASTDYLFGESVESLVNPKVFIPRLLELITLLSPPASLSHILLLLSLRTSRYPAQLASLNHFFNPILLLLFTPLPFIVSNMHPNCLDRLRKSLLDNPRNSNNPLQNRPLLAHLLPLQIPLLPHRPQQLRLPLRRKGNLERPL